MSNVEIQRVMNKIRVAKDTIVECHIAKDKTSDRNEIIRLNKKLRSAQADKKLYEQDLEWVKYNSNLPNKFLENEKRLKD